jgi:hypothetical protein
MGDGETRCQIDENFSKMSIRIQLMLESDEVRLIDGCGGYRLEKGECGCG